MDNQAEKQKNHFKNISDDYYSSRQHNNHLLLKELMWAYFFADKEYLAKQNMRVLEPMCGYGEGKRILEKCLNIMIQYEGIDYSEDMVNIAKAINPKININVTNVMRFHTSQQYDLIILLGGLHHIHDYAEKVVRKFYTFLRPGGYFINFEPTYNNCLYKVIRKNIYRSNSIFDEQTEDAFALTKINRIYLSSGFKIIDQIFPGLISYVFYYNPDAFPCLNIGKEWLVRLLFNIDKIIFKSRIGRKFSFATLTLLQKI